MPPKRDRPEVPVSDRVTRSRNLSAGQAPQEPSYPNQEPRSPSTASSSETLVADSSGPSVWSIADSFSETSFTSSIDVTSTQEFCLPHPDTLPPLIEQTYSPTEFDQTGFFHTAVEMADDNEDQGAGGGQRVPPNQAPGVSADMIALINMFQQQQVCK